MNKPSVWTRLRAIAQGEISTEMLEAYRRASLVVLELLDRMEHARLEAKDKGLTAWTLPESTQAEILCAWNAYVLQNLGNEFLDADAVCDPRTVGFVPPITSDQVMAFFTPVEGWLGRARQAEADAHYRLDVPVPAPLPAWSDVEPCPNSHLLGMLNAMRTIRQYSRSAVDFLGDTPPSDEEQARQYSTIRGLYAAADAKAQYAEDMHGANPSQAVHEMVEPTIKEAIETFHRVGQLAAMPKLAAVVKAPPIVPVPPAPPRIDPRSPGFDPWCLTDPIARTNLRYDREAQSAIERMWHYDSDTVATLGIWAEIRSAEARGEIGKAIGRNGRPIGYFFCCPWGTVYEVHRPVYIAGRFLTPYSQFAIDVTAEGVELGHPFRRGIKVGNFQPTQEFEYGDPNEPPDH
ncbi:hypothetical protein EON79_04105 [bacterium]|nr:MAG: hypothetical protein EON79_04105 [bacterium]